jgi:predicted unusual protein kinase regulating ubiquinone biosynthesis (AarF/ABC1/UbiB family)
MAIVERLSRYREFAAFLAKYAHADFVIDEEADRSAKNAGSAGKTAADADAFARDIEALGPTFIKLGQLLSTRADMLPATYVDALARLQDEIEPFPYSEVVAIVEDELGVRLSKAFAEFDSTPLAAASLGQVHRAVLRSGREVAVKVQRPQVREQVRRDLDALSDLAPLLERVAGVSRSLDVPRVLDEFRRTVLRELDYQQEARHMTALAHQLRDFESIVVPLPIDDYTTSRVLTMDFIAGTKITSVSRVEWTEVDGAALANDLCRAYLQQILVDGLFHADPHPGNVLLTPDHRLALIDVGMVGRLSMTLQDQLLRLMLAIADARGDEAASVIVSLGDTHEDFDEALVRETVIEVVGGHQNTPAKSLNVGRVMLDTVRTSGRYGLRLPAELALLGKTLLNLHHIGRLLDPEFDVNGSMRRNATGLMRRRMWKTLTPAHLLSSTLEVRDLAERLPERLNRILDAIAANDVRLKVELIDHGSIIDGLQKVANRIALGVVLAALIVGAAMLMRVQTTFTILGYPGIAMLLFLAAAAGGFWMAWTILAGDVKRTSARARRP